MFLGIKITNMISQKEKRGFFLKLQIKYILKLNIKKLTKFNFRMLLLLVFSEM